MATAANQRPSNDKQRKPGRPRADIDPEDVLKLARLQCTNAEIAAFFSVCEKTIRNNFSEIVAKGRDEGKTSLRRAIWKNALGGNATMQIWLSKQHLGFSDKVEQTASRITRIVIAGQTEVVREINRGAN